MQVYRAFDGAPAAARWLYWSLSYEVNTLSKKLTNKGSLDDAASLVATQVVSARSCDIKNKNLLRQVNAVIRCIPQVDSLIGYR